MSMVNIDLCRRLVSLYVEVFALTQNKIFFFTFKGGSCIQGYCDPPERLTSYPPIVIIPPEFFFYSEFLFRFTLWGGGDENLGDDD